MKHCIRIVGGQYRRTRVPVPVAPGLRPTPDRVRETLFNWLSHLWDRDFSDKHVLDLFAGSGALGFEAASRGVAHVQMVESERHVVTSLRALRDKLKADAVRIHASDALTALGRMDAARYDLILLDPPFGQGWLEQLWNRLPGLLTHEGLIYVESEQPVVVPSGFVCLRQDRAGAVHYCLLQIAASQKNVNNGDFGPPPATDAVPKQS